MLYLQDLEAVLAHHGPSVNVGGRKVGQQERVAFLTPHSIHAAVPANSKDLSFVYLVSPGYPSKLRVQVTISLGTSLISSSKAG